MPRKEKKERTKKNGSGHRLKLSTPTQASDAPMGEEGKNKKQREEKKKKTVIGAPTQISGPFDSLLRPAWIVRWSYSETSPATGGID